MKSTPQTPSSYDDFADTFGKSREGMHWPEIDQILEDFTFSLSERNTWNIADIGCGNGRLVSHIVSGEFMPLFLPRKSTYTGLDLSENLLRQAETLDTSEIFSETKWIHGNMSEIGEILSEQKFDAVFFVASFHHLMTYEDRLSVLLQAKKLLAKGGKIYLANWHLLSPSQSRYESSLTEKYPDGSADFSIKIGAHQRFYHAFSESEYQRLADEAGLQIQLIQFGERNSIFILQ